jgi:ribonuclease kappa
MRICGPKCSLCLLLVSSWGIVQLVRVLLKSRVIPAHLSLHPPGLNTAAFVDDLPTAPEEDLAAKSLEEFYNILDAAFAQNAYNCWLATGLFILTWLVSWHQFSNNAGAR